MLQPGTQAPEFTLPDQTGSEVSLTTLTHHGPLILYFYPADFTPGCTREACSIRDIYGELHRAGIAVAGVSPQSADSHRSFSEHYQLPFTLLADANKTVIRLFGVDGPLGFGVRRATFLIDSTRLIQAAVLADFRIGKHEEFIAKTLALKGQR